MQQRPSPGVNSCEYDYRVNSCEYDYRVNSGKYDYRVNSGEYDYRVNSGEHDYICQTNYVGYLLQCRMKFRVQPIVWTYENWCNASIPSKTIYSQTLWTVSLYSNSKELHQYQQNEQ